MNLTDNLNTRFDSVKTLVKIIHTLQVSTLTTKSPGTVSPREETRVSECGSVGPGSLRRNRHSCYQISLISCRFTNGRWSL